jgi:hypothetical protein
MAQVRHQPDPTEQTERSFLGHVDNHGIARRATEKGDNTVRAMTGVLHRAFVATDHESHADIMTMG